MRLSRNFIISFIRGAGTAAGAFVAKECLLLIKDERKRDKVKNKLITIKQTIIKV